MTAGMESLSTQYEAQVFATNSVVHGLAIPENEQYVHASELPDAHGFVTCTTKDGSTISVPSANLQTLQPDELAVFLMASPIIVSLSTPRDVILHFSQLSNGTPLSDPGSHAAKMMVTAVRLTQEQGWLAEQHFGLIRASDDQTGIFGITHLRIESSAQFTEADIPDFHSIRKKAMISICRDLSLSAVATVEGKQQTDNSGFIKIGFETSDCYRLALLQKIRVSDQENGPIHIELDGPSKCIDLTSKGTQFFDANNHK